MSERGTSSDCPSLEPSPSEVKKKRTKGKEWQEEVKELQELAKQEKYLSKKEKFNG